MGKAVKAIKQERPPLIPVPRLFRLFQGRTGGRKRKMTGSKIKSSETLLASGITPREVAGNLGKSIPTLYRWLPASADYNLLSLKVEQID